MLEYEKKYWNSGLKYIAGIDEAGRGPLAGPVVSAAVIFPKNIDMPEVNDSKKVSEKKRLKLFQDIYDNAICIGIGIVHEDKIDSENILQATYQSMRKSIGELNIRPDILLIDGNRADIKHYEQESIINGDQKSLSIAAASIIAKVTRDKIMLDYDIIFPEYGFNKNKGYGTKQHLESIKEYKAVPIHRKSFNPVSKYLPNYAYFKEKGLFDKLGMQILACHYIRLGHRIEKVLYLNTAKIKYHIVSLYNKVIYFTMVSSVLKGNNENRKAILEEFDLEYFKDIFKKYINENDICYEYCMCKGEVFIGNKKPIIKTNTLYLSDKKEIQ
tara:strand:+ start:1124 stop:2107 length:984 start_codon:yes stop_codon:yes gene_type:complete